MATVRKHKSTIMSIAAIFYRPGSYGFNAMVCDLSTYLWQVLASVPPKWNVDDEPGWVYTVLYRKAYKLSRDEHHYQSRLVYDVDLSNVAYGDHGDLLLEKMYYLICRLDEEEQEMITQYFKYGNMMKMSKAMGLGYLKVVRRMSDIRNKLVRLNNMLGDDFDSEAMGDGGISAADDEELENTTE